MGTSGNVHIEVNVYDKKMMTKSSYRWLASNSKTIENLMIFLYCKKDDASIGHDHFLTCSESKGKNKCKET